MNFLSWFRERKSSPRPLTIEDLLADGFYTGSAKSGVAVTWKTALQAATALACARVIAEGLAQVPLKLFESQNQVRTPATGHPLYSLLHDSPNEWQTSFEFIEQIALHLVLCGNAFVFVNRPLGRVAELLPYEPQQVIVKREGYALSYDMAQRHRFLIHVRVIYGSQQLAERRRGPHEP